ncbi:hypothetical protein [Paenibacillus albiflavus]|nr:hypothetical protein [Paenibacillus albiflavus]
MTDQPVFYIVLIGLVIIVFAQILIKSNKTSSKPNTQAFEEFEQTVELFASDLEEQNEAIVQLFQDTKRDYELHLAKQTGKIEFLEKQSSEMAHEMAELRHMLSEIRLGIHAKESEQAAVQQIQSSEKLAAMETSPMSALVSTQAVIVEQAILDPMEVEPAVESEKTFPTVKDRYPEVFDLYENGKSIEYIAKKLGKNKGEVSLILMLSQQEEAAK